MTEKKPYVPMKKVVKETAKDISSYLKPVFDFIKGAGEGFFEVSIAPYIFPTLIRQTFSEECSKAEENGAWGGCTLGVVGWIFQSALYYQACKAGHPEALLIPVVTNIASALYEKGKKVKKRLEDEITEEK